MRTWSVLVVGALVLSACTSSGSDASEPSATPQVAEILSTPEEEDFVRPEPIGVIVNKYDLRAGRCFTVFDVVDPSGILLQEHREVACEVPHDAEVYLDTLVPGIAGTPFPGDGFLDEWAQGRCYEDFGGFVGTDYERSELDIGWFRPTFETWNGPGVHRGVICYVDSFEGGQLVGSMGGSGI